MFEIRQIVVVEQKAEICNTILRALPDWFGVEASIVGYVDTTQKMPFWAAFKAREPVGFIALKVHNSYTSEVCVMGVLEEYHRHGIGRELISKCIVFCAEGGTEYLTVKTLDESAGSDSYAKTREFYRSMGFRPLEIFPMYWDKDNPCLLMAKFLFDDKKTNDR